MQLDKVRHNLRGSQPSLDAAAVPQSDTETLAALGAVPAVDPASAQQSADSLDPSALAVVTSTATADYVVVTPGGTLLTDSRGNTLALRSDGTVAWNGIAQNWGNYSAAGALGGELFLETSAGLIRDVEAGTVVTNPTASNQPF